MEAPAAVAVPRPLPRNPGMGTCATRQYIILIILLPLQFLLIIRTLLLSVYLLSTATCKHILDKFLREESSISTRVTRKSKHNALGIRRHTVSSRYFLLVAPSISLFGRRISLSGDQRGGAQFISKLSGRLPDKPYTISLVASPIL